MNPFPIPEPCPCCGEIPKLNQRNTLTNNPIIACMNATCQNKTYFEGTTIGEVLGKWDAWCFTKQNEYER